MKPVLHCRYFKEPTQISEPRLRYLVKLVEGGSRETGFHGGERENLKGEKPGG